MFSAQWVTAVIQLDIKLSLKLALDDITPVSMEDLSEFFQACKTGNFEKVKSLLREDIVNSLKLIWDVYRPIPHTERRMFDDNKLSPLHHLASGGHIQVRSKEFKRSYYKYDGPDVTFSKNFIFSHV